MYILRSFIENMIKPALKNQDGKLYQDMPNQGSLVLVRRKGKIHGCFIRDNKLLRLSTDSETGRMEGMICIAKVMDIVPNINAAFLRIEGDRKCFIKLEDLQGGHNLSRPGKPFAQGDNCLIQVIKEPSKGKEASATCKIRVKDAVYADLLEKASYRSDYSVLLEPVPKYQELITALTHEDSAAYEKILTDDKEIFEKTKLFMSEHSPNMLEKLHFYEDCLVSLKVLYGLEGKFSEALSDRVWLKCGGFLYIEQTQAMTVIDVNSGKYDKKSNREETYFKVNMEAAEEIATQIFVRNLTGIIVIDFINMECREHREILLKTLTTVLGNDANPARVWGFTRLGLVEITRKKCDKTIYEQILV